LHNYKWYFKNPSQFIILYILLKEWLRKMTFPSNKLVVYEINGTRRRHDIARNTEKCFGFVYTFKHQTCLSIEKILCIFSRRNEINMGFKLSWFPDCNAKIKIWISGHRSFIQNCIHVLSKNAFNDVEIEQINFIKASCFYSAL
jgi:hypothetical protein